MCERHMDQLPLTHPQLGTKPETQACALTGNRTWDLSGHRLLLNPLSHTSQGFCFVLFCFLNEDSLREFWDNTKHSNIHIIEIPESQKRKEQKLYFKK